MQVDNEVMIIGDLNCPGYYKCVTNETNDKIAKCICDFAFLNRLQQHNTIKNQNQVILDLCFTRLIGHRITINLNSNPLTKIDKHHPPLDIGLSNKLNTKVKAINCKIKNVKIIEKFLYKNWIIENQIMIFIIIICHL